ncbi:GAF domain-containing sensor histidine kinase [Leptospira brenneri]|uniref:histidine kinase n=1 Tax=Leptospira brenneri TaxID=2023182 RepID=A0A2M9Y2F3_9LEPT|nr:ATP-binding protein [Leptospira brenneri]PJZ45566.1 histidine kinase [Leptospira brenneri]TGK92058.1 GAF domain-containing sensor histidine kinase [Leptospira brenneri]
MKGLEKELNRARAEQRILAQVSSHPAIRSGEILIFARFITKSVSELLGIERVGVWLFNETKDELLNVDTFFLSKGEHGSGGILKEQEFREEFQYLVTEKYVDASDPYTDPRTKGFIESYLKPNNITAMLDGVIRMGEELIGTLCFEHVGKPHSWEENEIIFCSQLGDQIALTVSNLRKNEINKELQAREKELRELNESLERLVEERTKNLKITNAELEVTITSLQKTQAQLILSEKMASLGQLVAGIAHEINNPIAAIHASAQNLKQSLFDSELSLFQKELKDLLPSLEKQKLFLNCLDVLKTRVEMVSGKERMRRRKEIESWLKSKSIPESFSYQLIDSGFELPILEEFEILFQDSDVFAIVSLLAEEITVYQSLSIMQLAVERASKMTFALKNFARFEVSSSPVRTNLEENIETVITLYQNQFKKKVTLVREYASIPLIEGYPEELLHLWTNLIYNGLQAMTFFGEMKIRTEVFQGMVRVTVEDSGSGIPFDVQSRIFEPFFTTKPSGEGSGLGLDICRKIVERHNGRIHFETRPGKTKFFVDLPFFLKT